MRDRVTGEIRPTDDVDVLIEVAHYSAYAKIEEKLRNKGFVNDLESGIICRYVIKGIIVDIIPIEGSILGFTNRWYKEGFTNAIEYRIDKTHAISIFKPEYFMASKLEAFKNRGKNDGRTSTDFEDIIYILNSRSVIWKEMAESSQPLKAWLQNEFKILLDNSYIDEWISVHLDTQEQSRINFIMSGMQEFGDA